MKLIRSFILASLVGAILAAGAVNAQTSPIQLLVEKAHSLEGRGRYDLAAQTWRQILTADPGDAEALAGLARYAKRTGKTDEAQHYLDLLRKVDPHNSGLVEIQSLKPTPDLHPRLEEAVRLAANHEFARAMDVYHEVFGDNPPPGGWAIAYYETEASVPGGWEKATAALRQLSERYPAVQEYKASLGRLLTYRPSTRMAGVKLLETQSVLTESARQSWRQALLWEKSNPAFLPGIHEYLTRYHDSELQSIEAALTADLHRSEGSRRPEARDQQQGYEDLKAGDLEAAVQKFTAALQQNPNSVEALSGLGFVRLKQQDFAGAQSYFERAKRISPENRAVAEGLQTASFWSLMKNGAKDLDASSVESSIASFKSAVSARPNSPEANIALAGALMKAGSYSEAAGVYQRLVRLQPGNADAWREFVSAKLHADGPAEALAVMRAIPASVALKLKRNIEFVALSADVYYAAGEAASAQSSFRELEALVNSHSGELREDLRVQIAGLCLRFKKPEVAARSMSQLLDENPQNAGAWEVLLAALVENHQEQSAAQNLQQMPQSVYTAALSRPGFVRSVAAIDTATGRLDEAEEALAKLANTEKSKGTAEAITTQLQLASVYLKQENTAKAEELLAELSESNPGNTDVWKSYAALLHNTHRDAEVAGLRERMPRKVSAQLLNDPEYISVLAAAEGTAGNREAACRLLEDAMAKAKLHGEPAPATLQLQLAWLLLDAPDRQSELFSLLQQTQKQSDLARAESRQVSDIWSTWILRASQAASDSGNSARALALLEQGCRMLPNDGHLKGALAGNLLKAGETRRALNVYKNWGLRGAAASDYVGAIGAAMTEQDKTYSNAWLQEALNKWPNDSQILDLAGKQAAGAGDYKKAKLYWREALAASRSNDAKDSPLAALASTAGHDSSTGFRDLLLGNESPAADGPAESDLQSAPTTFARDFTESGLKAELRAPRPNAAADIVPSAVLPQSDSVRDQLASVDGRNTPYLGTGDLVQGRSGQPGLDRLVIEQAEMEASTTIGDQVRVSVVAKPTYVESGSGTPQGNFRFGTQASGSAIPMQTASGLAAEGQISSRDFGIHFGASPEGFLVRNIIGGFRLTPANGPITLMFDRDSLQDTMLSFAGARDPETGTIWGGVLANTASIKGNWGTDRSGFYVSTGYQWITGVNVQRNTRIDGNLGTYWKALTLPEGSLTIGMNVFAMHYDKNLRYFSLGQGGYFSPQQYFLFSVPFRWTGAYKQRLQYMLAASLGSQHFQEDASPYFPFSPASGDYYPAMSSTGANYSVEAKMSYQIAPNWFLGAWANANNARDYTSQSAGLFVRYSFQARPLLQDNYVPSIPDWKGQQPFRAF